MRPDEIESARRDLLLWSTPIVADVTRERYARLLAPGHLSSRVVASAHARLWRGLLGGDQEKRQNARRELINLARLAGLDKSDVDALDQEVLEELVTVVTERFGRSPQLMQCYTRLLLTASADLAGIRLAAVA